MECIKCHYCDTAYKISVCEITHVCNTKSCDLPDDSLVPSMDICYNCENWFGGGDWGLSCKENYYDCETNGFRKACDKFTRKREIN